MNGSPTNATLASLALVAATIGCGTSSPAKAPATTTIAAVATASSTPAPKPLDCDTLCAKANSVTGCATAPENVSACVDLCTRMLVGACKAQVEAELACAAKVTLACKPEGAVDWGACAAEQRAANECARDSMRSSPVTSP